MVYFISEVILSQVHSEMHTLPDSLVPIMPPPPWATYVQQSHNVNQHSDPILVVVTSKSKPLPIHSPFYRPYHTIFPSLSAAHHQIRCGPAVPSPIFVVTVDSSCSQPYTLYCQPSTEPQLPVCPPWPTSATTSAGANDNSSRSISKPSSC